MAPKPITGEHFPHERDQRPQDSGEVDSDATDYIRHIGAHAIGSDVLIASVELPETPDADAQQLESERTKNTTENLRELEKRFGERFVKGNLMEGGGYTDGAARELLAGFMDRPGFANELKRIIPNKHGALQLLKDNHAYIQATLEQLYKDDPTYERQPVKDPYELARSTHYELTGPFASTSEFVPLDKQDFRPHERLCTFNKPDGRLKEYHILWLRHAEADGTLPADALTADTLSEAWKTYLKTIGRYDAGSDSYDLADLHPTRDDPYGTSSMSVQISRKGRHVSIKNRYNHTVGNPDNTLDNDLDHVAYGLRRAVYALVGREDLMDKTGVTIAEGYISDNDGGIHAYEYEENNVYYGDYEYISNGVVTTINRDKYYMISPQVYAPISDKGEEINLRPKKASDTLAVGRDVQYLYANRGKADEKDPRIAKTRKEKADKLRREKIAELRQARAEGDIGEVTSQLIESIREQAASSHAGYLEVATDLGQQPISEKEFTALLEAKMAEWHENGVIDYLVRELVENDSRPDLIATPNVLADWKALRSMAKKFGEGQPKETFINDDLYKNYSARELSGALTDGALRFSLIPSRSTVRLGRNTVDRLLLILAQMQSENPRLNLKVPSVLDAITYWQTLRARGDALADETTFARTFIRHFDLAKKRLGRWSLVLFSCVDGGGMPNLSDHTAGHGFTAKVAVG